jgi:hypothetical protein
MGGIYWLASYPKSGNTWFRSVLANFRATGDAPVDINQLNTGTIASSRMWVDDILGVDTADLTQDEVEAIRPDIYRWSVAENPTELGYHKIHDAYAYRADGRPLVDDTASLGAVYLLRNPLDVAPSLANHNGIDIDAAIALMGDPNHALARAKNRLTGQLLQRMGSWSQHVLSWVEARDIPVFVLRYEDMHADPIATFGTAFAALGLPENPQRLERAVAFSQFDTLAAQEAAHGFRERPSQKRRFFRKGKAGDWQHSLSPAQVAQIIADHGPVMRRFGYLDDAGQPLV